MLICTDRWSLAVISLLVHELRGGGVSVGASVRTTEAWTLRSGFQAGTPPGDSVAQMGTLAGLRRHEHANAH